MKILITAFAFSLLASCSSMINETATTAMPDVPTDAATTAMPDVEVPMDECNCVCGEGEDSSSPSLFRVWICELVNWRCELKKWETVFRNWWLNSCEESDSEALYLPVYTCPNVSMFECKCGEQECLPDANGCTFCQCNGGSFKYSSRFLGFWRLEQQRFRQLREIYNNRTARCSQRVSGDECNSTVTEASSVPPPPGSSTAPGF